MNLTVELHWQLHQLLHRQFTLEDLRHVEELFPERWGGWHFDLQSCCLLHEKLSRDLREHPGFWPLTGGAVALASITTPALAMKTLQDSTHSNLGGPDVQGDLLRALFDVLVPRQGDGKPAGNFPDQIDAEHMVRVYVASLRRIREVRANLTAGADRLAVGCSG